MLAVVIAICCFTYTFGGQITWPEEKHLKNVRQLTWGGENVAAVFSLDGHSIVYQGAGVDRYGTRCDAVYRMDADEPANDQTPQRLSSGVGLATRPDFYPDGRELLYSSTSQSQSYKHDIHNCPMRLCGTTRRRKDRELDAICKSGHTWDVFPEYDVFQVNRFGNAILALTTTPGYDADADLSPDGTKVVFTSMRTGDPEIWIMDSDGLNQRQNKGRPTVRYGNQVYAGGEWSFVLHVFDAAMDFDLQLGHSKTNLCSGSERALTSTVGYEGGAKFSNDGKKIVFQASRPKTEKQLEKYKKLLSYNLVSPLAMELFIMNVDGSNITQLTSLGGANLSPIFMKRDNRVIFASNFQSIGNCGDFTIYIIDVDGNNLEQVTENNGGFDAFPAFDAEHKRFLWASSRNSTVHGETNIFIADWVDDVPETKKVLPNAVIEQKS